MTKDELIAMMDDLQVIYDKLLAHHAARTDWHNIIDQKMLAVNAELEFNIKLTDQVGDCIGSIEDYIDTLPDDPEDDPCYSYDYQ